MQKLAISRSVSENRRELWQFGAWTIVLLCGISLTSSPLGLSSVPDVIGILLLLFVSTGIGWIYIISRRGIGLLNTPLDSGFIVLLLVSLGSTLTSIDPSRSWRTLINWASIIIVYYFAVTAFRSGWKTKIFVNALLFVIAVYILFGYFELAFSLLSWFSAPGEQTFPSIGQLRVSGLINGPNTFAFFVNTGLILAIGKLAVTKLRPIWLVVWLVISIPVIVFHGSRNGWLALLFSFGCLMLFLALWRSKGTHISIRTWIRLAVVLLVGATLTVGLIYFVRQSTIQSSNSLGYLYRYTFWKIALETFLRSPLFGQGPATFASSYLQSITVPSDRLYVRAHSLYMDTLAELGLAGIFAVLLLSGQVVWLAWSRLRRGKWTTLTPTFLAALIPFFIYSIFDSPWTQQILLIAILLAAIVTELVPLSTYPPTVDNRWHRAKTWIWLLIWLIIVLAGVIGWRAAKLHTSSIVKANEGDWKGALDLLNAAQVQLPLDDTAYMLTMAFTEGVIASKDDLHLESAIQSYKKGIEREPGWSVNHANLASLYWQMGMSADAINAMQKAIALAPSVSLYHLNLGLWYENLGKTDSAQAEYQKLLTLDPNAGNDRFWMTNPLRRELWLSIQSNRMKKSDKNTSIAEIYTALENDQLNLARENLRQLVIEEPNSPSIQLVLGITQLYLGEMEAARETLQRALEIDGPTRRVIPMWLSVLPGAPTEQTEQSLENIGRHSVFGPDQADKNTYFRDVFVSSSLRAELLPQLKCFSFSSELMQQMRLLRELFVRNSDDEMSKFLDSYLHANESGIESCMDVK